MSVRHYVLLATDGFTKLPSTSDPCAPNDTLQEIYIMGFVGGLFKVDDKIINPNLDWKKSENWPKMKAMISTASLPSPIIWAEVEDQLYITLINLGMPVAGLMDPHTVHMHGAHVATQLDGFPEGSFGVPMWMDFNAPPPTATYYFLPESPGTLMYHCHVEASEHVQMGMYGALIIYPTKESLGRAGIFQDDKGRWWYYGTKLHHIPNTATNRNFAYNDVKTFFDKEYIMLLSDIDSVWHDSVRRGIPFKAANYKPDFWLVNGRAFPDTLLPHPQTPSQGSDPDLAQINYESYVHVKTGQKFLLRMINLGYQPVPWHIHGWHFTIVGKDAHPSPFLKIADELELDTHEVQAMGFTVDVASGETYDLILTADDKRPIYRNYIVNGQDCFPSLCSQMKALQAVDPAVIADIPVEPVKCPNPTTVNYVDICNGTQGADRFFPQFYPMHNHDDYKVTNTIINSNASIYPGGQLTFIQTDEPQPCSRDEYDDDYDNGYNYDNDNEENDD
ncbi:MAG TPA: multicopper oxidase domain-containing protein [Pseudobacteroides sp.]|uniref:multicopper oxidase domain-containing protein n=1 Tax=Pseudobacteroides sp. TaxID=1968840 RepID=UPI002F92CDFB